MVPYKFLKYLFKFCELCHWNLNRNCIEFKGILANCFSSLTLKINCTDILLKWKLLYRPLWQSLSFFNLKFNQVCNVYEMDLLLIYLSTYLSVCLSIIYQSSFSHLVAVDLFISLKMLCSIHNISHCLIL